MKIASVVGTRPNFIKIAALVHELSKHNLDHLLIHTGQHYDQKMSKLFFEELGLPKPDINLGVGSGTYGEQIGNIIIGIEKVLQKEKPDLVLVVGDVNSTFAAALVAKRLGIKVAHVESGLRSFDMSMPEEINRILTDRISDFLFTTEESANINLKNEGIPKSKIHFVGNVMIDTLNSHRKKSLSSKILGKLRLSKKDYAILTLHRPSNVDNKESLGEILEMLESFQAKTKVVFPIHPRTRKNLEKFNLYKKLTNLANVVISEPLGYIDFLCLMANSRLVLTDSGGIQEETTVLGIPCITLRENTERPVTLEQGTNLIVSTNTKKIMEAFDRAIKIEQLMPKTPKYWDGKASGRIVSTILDKFKQ